MKKTILGFTLLSLLFVGCGETEEIKDEQINKRKSNGVDLFYGGTITIAEDETFQSLFPIEVVDLSSFNAVNQLHDGLIRYDTKDFSLQSAVAENWEVDAAGLVYTFYLRKDVLFHDDVCFKEGKGRSVTAEDVKYTFELLSSKDFKINFDPIVKPYIKGAEDFFNGKTDQIEGIEVVDDFTIKFTLNQASPSFIYTLAMPNTSIIAKEAYEKYGKEMTVGCGPFKFIKPVDITKELSFIYNEKYYLKDENGNSLPYLDTVTYVFLPSKLKQLEYFNQNKLSIINGLPSSKIAQVVSEKIENFKNNPPKTILDRQPELQTQYYGFSCTRPPFDNILVRKAFNYAINRNDIVNDILNGQGTPGLHGITPKIPTFTNYDFSKIKGYRYDPMLAKELLAEAGYPNGEGFPETTLEINLGGNVHKLVSTEVERQLKQTLNIKLSIDQVSFKKKIEHSKFSKSEIYRASWVADFPSPESFLSILYGGDVPSTLDEPSYPNTMRYVNPAFDSLFLAGKTAIDNATSYNNFAAAEALMMEDAPILILWYAENYTMFHSEVRSYFNNGLKIADFSEVYIKTMTAEENTPKED